MPVLNPSPQQPPEKMERTVANFANDGVTATEKLVSRLTQLRDRLAGPMPLPPAPTAGGQIQSLPNGVVAMAQTLHGNVIVAHEILTDIEQLIG